MAKDGDMRMLGAVDGYAHAIADIRWQIGYLLNTHIDRRHTRKIAARAAVLRPLRAIEEKLIKHHADCLVAYRKTTE